MFGFFSEAKKVAKRTSAENFAISEISKYFHMKIWDAEKAAKPYLSSVWSVCGDSFDTGMFSQYEVAMFLFFEFANDIDCNPYSVDEYAKAIAYSWISNNFYNLHEEVRELTSDATTWYENKFNPQTYPSNEVLRCNSCNQFIWANPQFVTFWCKRCSAQNKKIRL